MATFILVHGGGHGGWCYNKLSPLLRAKGHLVLSPSLTGCGDRKHLLSPEVGLDTHVTDIVNLIDYENLTDVILVGHSYGGMVITGVADRVADRIGHIVYLDAAHPRDGESLADVAPLQMGPVHQGAQTVDGVELVMWPMPGMARFFGIDDPADIAWVDAKLTPHPWKCFSEPLHFQNGDAAKNVPRTNINCVEALRTSIPEARARQLEGGRNLEIDTGHDLMITEPEKVAAMLLEIMDL